MIARVMRDKGVFEYLQAAEQVLQKYSQAEFYLAGAIDERMSEADKALFEKLCTHQRIHYLGHVSDIAHRLEESAVFVLPSYYEGKPRSSMEAMAVGRPIITTDVRGCRETVKDGINGYLVPVRHADFLAEAMQKFLVPAGLDLILSMGAEGRGMVEEEHDVRYINERIVCLL